MLHGSSTTPVEPPVSDKAANSVEGFQAMERNGRLNRLDKTPLHELSSKDAFLLFVSAIPSISVYESAWTFSGNQLVTIGPELFVRAIQVEYFAFPFSAAVELFKFVQRKVVSDVSLSNYNLNPVDPAIVQKWFDAIVPSAQQMIAEFSRPSENQKGGREVNVNSNVIQIGGGVAASSNVATGNQQGENLLPTNLSNVYSPNQNFQTRELSFPAAKVTSFSIGGPRTAFQNSNIPNVLMGSDHIRFLQNYAPLAANLAAQNQFGIQNFSPMVASAAQMLPQYVGAQQPHHLSQMVASAAQMLHQNVGAQQPHHQSQTVASAAQMLQPNQNFSAQTPQHLGQTTASAAQNPFPQQSATPLYSPAPMDASASQLAQLMQNPQLSQLLHSFQAQSRSSRPMLPWETAAMGDPFLQDPSMPKGYKKLSMNKVVAAAIQARLKSPSLLDTSKAIRWPVFDSFNAEEFFRVRKEYNEAVKLSVPSGLFNSFKSCLSLTAQNAAKAVFRLSDERFISLEDEMFMKWCALEFGPGNKRDAIKLLKSVRMFHQDASHHQSEFLVKFDQVCYDHEMAVNDIVDSQEKWPFDPEDIECSALTLKEIQKEWKEIFPKQDGSKVFSVQLRKCRLFIEHNVEMPFNEQVSRLRASFAKKDRAVLLDGDKYSTEPSVQRKKFSSGGGSGYYKNSVAVSAIQDRPNKRDRESAGGGKAKVARRVVPGHERGLSCGSLNNHHGLGCHKDTCVAFGTEWDKSKGKKYIWKSSEDEDSVRIPNADYNKKLKENPQIIENWKKAAHARRSKPRVGVSALASVREEEESENDFPDQDEVDNVSDNDSDADSVNSSAYFEEEIQVDVAAATAGSSTITDGFDELGHEEQFYGVTRFAQNDEFQVRTLMDPGATINIICPTVANRAAIQRKQLAVNIFQGKRKQASVEEMVKCAFELLRSDGKYTKHVEWFAVCDLGYDVLLGRRFCRREGFTSFDEKLKKFCELPARLEGMSVSALQVRQQRLTLRFDRVLAPTGQARYKRSAKAVFGIANAERDTIGEFLLHAENELSSLMVLSRKVENGFNYVLLSFTIDMLDGKRSNKRQHWFQVVDGNELTISVALVSDQMANVAKAPRIVSLSSAKGIESGKLKPSDRKRILPDTQQPDGATLSSKRRLQEPPLSDTDNDCVSGDYRKTLGFAKGFSATEKTLTESEVEARKLKISELSRDVQCANELKFASYHPVKGYRLHRNADRPPVLGWKDHANHVPSEKFWGDQAQIRAAADAAQAQYTCSRRYHAYCSMLSKAEASELKVGKAPGIDHWIDQVNACKSIVSVAAVDADGEPWESEFKAGDYVEIINAVIKPELNGQRVRLFSKTIDEKFWIIRVLGKNQGKRRCSEMLFKKLDVLEQQRSVPTGADAGFDDVGIDESGQPNIELKTLAHRQFGKEFSKELTLRINALKLKFPKVFTTDVTEPCDFEPMKIRLIPNAVLPSKARFYRNTPKMREEVKRQIQEQLDWGAIKKCVTPCVSDVLLVKRPHMPGKFRFVVSYIKLNDATVKEQLLMPDPKSQHERLAGKKIFGALDFSSYYRQIRLHEESQYLTGFASDEGTFCYTRVPMGITGACQYAQKVLQDALAQDSALGPLGVRNYFDDLPFGAETEDEFMTVLEALLKFCERWKLKINPDKTILGVESITHVGFVVSKDGVSIDPERTRDIKELTSPQSVKKVQSVLGVFNYVRNFIPDFSGKAKFLTDKLAAAPKAVVDKGKVGKKREREATGAAAALSVDVAKANKAGAKVKVAKKFEWTSDDELQFAKLKECVLSAPLLAQLDYSLPIYIRCDASRFGAGAVLFQYDSRGYEHPVCYASRKFLPAERNWSTFSQEASTVVWALERFAEYTQGYHTIVESDHRNISFVKKSAMPQLARWRLRLQDMDFTIRYLSGPRNLCSDGLSRQHVDEVEVTLSDVIPECALPEATEAVYADIAALKVELECNYNSKSATVAEYRGKAREEDLELVATDPIRLIEEGEIKELEFDSDSSSSACSTEGDVNELNEFGPNGELLDEARQPIVVEEQQPGHLRVPLLDSEDEIIAVHNDLVGHAGTYVTLQRALKNNRVWGTRKQMLEDIDNFIRGCPCCQKMRKRSSQSLDKRHVLSGSPFAELSVDLLKLPKPDAFGMAYMVVIVDNFSRWTTLVAVRNKSVFETARALVKVIGDFGVPMRIRSDGGSEFVNGVIAGLTRMMGATQHVVVPYTPTANGIVERANRAILERMREMIFSKRLVQHPEHVWSDLLPLVQRSINASVHSATGTSPARIMFGDNLDLDRCLLTHMPCAKVLNVAKYVDALTYNQRIILEEADKHQSELCSKVIEAAHKAQGKKTKNGEVILPATKEIAVNDWVLVAPSPSYPLHKLSPRWLGPFKVLDCKSDSEVVVVEDTLKSKVRKFLRRQLELFDVSKISDVEGLKKVAESDGFEFPVEAIIGHALIEEGGVGVSPVQLPPTFKRGSWGKRKFQFLVKWTGFEEPSWVEYKVASRLVQFPGYVAVMPNLRMD